MAVQQYRYNGQVFVKQNWLERVLFEIGDSYDMSFIEENEATVMTAVLSLAGGLLGGLVAGRVGFAAGAGLGGAAGYELSKKVTLRELWCKFKEELKGILMIIIKHLKNWNAVDYIKAYNMLKNCATGREKLAKEIAIFVVDKVGAKLYSSLLQIANA